jgi:lysophospholipase
MGGLVALQAATRDRMMFERIFLSSPMVGLNAHPGWHARMGFFADVLSFIGLGRLPVGRREDKPASQMSFAGNPVTSDVARFTRMVDVLTARPDLEIGKPTVRWTAAALRAMADAARDEFPGTIKIPVLMLAAARDTVVSSAATEHLGVRMRTGKHAVIAGAKHELFMETDRIRGQVFAAFDAFVTQQSP